MGLTSHPLFQVNANFLAVLKMDTRQRETTRKINIFHMVAASSTLVIHRTPWMALQLCIVTIGCGTEVFLLARVCSFQTIKTRQNGDRHYVISLPIIMK